MFVPHKFGTQRRNVFMACKEYFGATAQPRGHIPEFCLSTPCGNHTITHFRGTDIFTPAQVKAQVAQAHYESPEQNYPT